MGCSLDEEVYINEKRSKVFNLMQKFIDNYDPNKLNKGFYLYGASLGNETRTDLHYGKDGKQSEREKRIMPVFNGENFVYSIFNFMTEQKMNDIQ